VNLDGASVHGGSARVLAPSDPLAEMAFFTETANLQVRTTRAGSHGPRPVTPALLHSGVATQDGPATAVPAGSLRGRVWWQALRFLMSADLHHGRTESQATKTGCDVLAHARVHHQAVRTACVCRVLSLSRTAYLALAAAFPISAERVLGNLLEAAEEVRRRLVHASMRMGTCACACVRVCVCVRARTYAPLCEPMRACMFRPLSIVSAYEECIVSMLGLGTCLG
jgi:hypothetical protein